MEYPTGNRNGWTAGKPASEGKCGMHHGSCSRTNNCAKLKTLRNMTRPRHRQQSNLPQLTSSLIIESFRSLRCNQQDVHKTIRYKQCTCRQIQIISLILFSIPLLSLNIALSKTIVLQFWLDIPFPRTSGSQPH